MKKINALDLPISNEERESIHEQIDSILNSKNKWTNSSTVESVENEFAKNVNSKFAIAISTGSTAIEAMLIALEMENAIIFAPVLTAPPTILSCLNMKSKIILVDADKNDFGMDLNDLEKKIKLYRKNDEKAIIIYVHIGGFISSNIYKIKELADKNKITLLEDCAHAHGAILDSKHAGTFGIAGTYSFFLTKTITSGEGGIIITEDEEIARKLHMIRNYGKSDKGLHVIKGSSWRMNEFTAAILLSQIKKCNENYDRRKEIANIYNERLKNSSLLEPITNLNSGYYKYIIIIKENAKFDYLDFKQYMQIHNIQMPAKVYDNLVSEEPYIQKCFDTVLNVEDIFEKAVYLKNHHICLPMHLGLSDEDIKYVCETIEKYISERGV